VNFDEEGFREYLFNQRYSRGTVINYIARARAAFQVGATEPDQVVVVCSDKSAETRHAMRKSLRRYAEYLEATA
jgi:hypothetical protein